MSNCHWQKWYPCQMSMSKVNGKGHSGQNLLCPYLGISGPRLQFEFTYGYEMMHIACCIGEMPYCILRSSLNCQCHTIKNILTRIDPYSGSMNPVWIHRWFEIMHKVGSVTDEVPFCFAKLYIQIQDHPGQKVSNFLTRDLEIWHIINKAHLLCCFKLLASFQIHQ